MELMLVLLVVVVGVSIYYNRKSKGLDVNNDGKVDAADVKAATENVVEGVKAAADVNKDGKVDAADVAVVEEKVKTAAKKAATKVKETVKKVSTRKPKSAAK